MSLVDRVADWMAGMSVFAGDDGAWVEYKKNISQASDSPTAPWMFYDVLRAYYSNSGLYDQLRLILGDVVLDRYRDMHGLRNPANRITEFYVAHLWPGPLQRALPIVVEDNNENLINAIEDVWQWSNWGQKKQVAARMYAMLGDMFVKVVGDSDKGRVWMETIDPEDVVEFDKDERGYVTYIRVDVPRRRRVNNKIEDYVYTEEWSKQDLTFRRWEHTNPIGVPIEQLGTPKIEDDLNMVSDAGVDFVPFVHAPFRDLGGLRGVGSFTPLIDKIDEVNRKASRLSQQLFRHNDQTWVLESPNPSNAGDRARLPPALTKANETQVGGERILSIPAGWTLRSQIPEINYTASLESLASDMSELQQDAPEMAYWKLTESEQGQMSGRAIRFMLGPAIKRAEEARGNAEAALIRAHMMACTIGQNLGLPGFEPGTIGTWDNGDFWHEFEDREIIPTTPDEEAETETAELTNLTLKQVIGVPNQQLQVEAGYTEEEIASFDTMQGVDGLGNALLDNLNSGTGGVDNFGNPVDANGNPVDANGNPIGGNPNDQPAQ
jgi:hypothetical protein